MIKQRGLLLLLGMALPIAIAVIVARLSLPEMLSASVGNTTSIAKEGKKSARIIPDTLEEAKKMAADRLLHLQKLSQAEWDRERKTIAFKSPPRTIEAAIARTQLRIADLNRMTEADWKQERERLLKN